MDDPKKIVKDGYNAISYIYRDDFEGPECQDYHEWLDEFIPMLRTQSKILDIGCGCGIPVAKRLSGAFELIGVDISPVQIRRARKNVPQGYFIKADISKIDFEINYFHAVLALFSLFHLPTEEQHVVLQKTYKWLEPNGFFLVTFGEKEWTGYRKNWLNVENTMYWSYASEETCLTWMKDIGFKIHWRRVIPETPITHILILAQK